MSKNLHRRLRELQKIAALHQNQTATPIGGVPQNIAEQPYSAPASAFAEATVDKSKGLRQDSGLTGQQTATMAIGTPEHYKVIRRDLVFVMILIIVMVGLLFGLDWLVNNTALANWIVNLGSSIR